MTLTDAERAEIVHCEFKAAKAHARARNETDRGVDWRTFYEMEGIYWLLKALLIQGGGR